MKKIIKVNFFNNALSLQNKKILNSNWLKAVQFKYNIRANYNKYYLLVSKATLYYKDTSRLLILSPKGTMYFKGG